MSLIERMPMVVSPIRLLISSAVVDELIPKYCCVPRLSSTAAPARRNKS